jgi:ferredoxin
MKLSVNPDLCVGHGRCYALHPSLFEPDETGYSSATKSEVDTDDEIAAARSAVAECPEVAISLSE